MSHPMATVTAYPGLRPIITYPRDAVLEKEHVAAALGVGVRLVMKMDLPCFYPSIRPRYLWGQVLDHLAKKAKENAA